MYILYNLINILITTINTSSRSNYMNKSLQIKELQNEIAILKQFIVLLGGQAALDRIEKEIAVERTNRVLKVHEPTEFDNLIHELADYR